VASGTSITTGAFLALLFAAVLTRAATSARSSHGGSSRA
jgi:hypothetical protein